MKPVSSLFGGLAASLRTVFAAVLFVSVSLSAMAERQAVKLLAIGNSFSDYPTVYLPALAKAGGKTLVYGRASIGGCSLERHAKHLKQAEAGDPEGTAYDTKDPQTGKQRKMSLPELLKAQPWEIVTIQQASPLSFKLETYQPFADELIAAIHKYAPTAEIVVQETWAYREDHDFFKKIEGFTPQKMYTDLRSAYHTFADGKGYRIMPTGDALDLARKTKRWTYVEDTKFDRKTATEGQLPDQHASLNSGWSWGKDKEGKPVLAFDAIHLNTAGKYLGAVVWYQTIFDADEVPVDFLPKDLSAEDAADLRTHAKAAVIAERAREKKK